MTYEEAIWRLKDHFRIHDDGRPTPYLDDAEVMAYAAMEKQIPKKPSWEYLGDSLSNKDLITKCPFCDKGVEEGEHHCECGQALDWSK